MKRGRDQGGRAAAPALLAASLLLAACTADEAAREDSPPVAVADAAGLPAPEGLAPTADASGAPVPVAAAREDVPPIYMSLEADPGRPVSVVFAIDAGGEPGPADDPAIRLTPAGGECNPQELTRYGFEGEDARPVFGPAEAARGIDPRQLPAFMAVSVSRRMIERGLAATPEDTHPQNVCVRKLWENLVVEQARTAQASAGQ